LVLCERVFSLLHEPISGWTKACLAPAEGEGFPSITRNSLQLDEKRRDAVTCGLSLIKPEKDPTPKGSHAGPLSRVKCQSGKVALVNLRVFVPSVVIPLLMLR